MRNEMSPQILEQSGFNFGKGARVEGGLEE